MNAKASPHLNATKLAAKTAYKMANIKPDDIDLAEVHDCFTFAELMAYEDLVFVKWVKAAS